MRERVTDGGVCRIADASGAKAVSAGGGDLGDLHRETSDGAHGAAPAADAKEMVVPPTAGHTSMRARISSGPIISTGHDNSEPWWSAAIADFERRSCGDGLPDALLSQTHRALSVVVEAVEDDDGVAKKVRTATWGVCCVLLCSPRPRCAR